MVLHWISLGIEVIAVSLVPSLAVTLLKGRYMLLLAGLMGLFPLLWVASLKPANPSSWWARRFYDPERLERARHYQAGWDERWSS